MSEKKCIVSVEMRTIIDTIYPVGAYFWSSEDKDPATFIGGTWEQVKDRFILAAGDTHAAGSTGGEAQHTLTVDEMPRHTHYSNDGWDGYTDINYRNDAYKYITYGKNNSGAYGDDPYLSTNSGIDTTLSSTGGSKPHNNMPPYITAYCWHRTA